MLFLEGVAHFEHRQFELAESKFNQSLELVPDRISTMTNLAATLIKLKNFETARDVCQRAVSIDEQCSDAWHYLGVIDSEELNDAAALQKLHTALDLRGDDPAIHNSCGIALRNLGRADEALVCYDRALELDPDFSEAYYNRGQALEDLGRLEETLVCYERVLKLQPEYEYLYGTWLHVKMQLCDWSGLEDHTEKLAANIESGKPLTPPFPVLGLIASSSLQRKAAAIWVDNAHPADNSLGRIPSRSKSGPIRVGYYSADFGPHVVSSLTARLFEMHDRDRFEIIGFSTGRNAAHPMRARLESAFDEFIDVRSKTDVEVARLSRELGVDIAVDLGGHTKDSRTGIFALRAAPVQVNYIGYPGTMGAPYIDYIIADANVVPDELQAAYSEKIAYLRCFQANDPQRKIAEKTFTRRELGIPEAGFVFCCFNNNYKIIPEIFDAWMRILSGVATSVLFLYGGSATAESNLKREAQSRGVSPDRIIFGRRLAIPEYLARYRAADLFLDTYPFNGGATVSDALWAGLPVLTLAGESFAGRMGAALLNAVDMGDLVVGTKERYVSLAVALANESERHTALRQKLARNRLTEPLFDMALFARQVEAAYMEMYQRHHAGLSPEHIFVPA